MGSGARPQLSFVVPALDEEASIPIVYERLVSAAESLGMPFEILFVDDGSSDGTWGLIEDLHESDSRVGGLRLSRNFGHQHALLAGIEAARGDAVITLDADLQHPPELIETLVREWQSGSMIVHTLRESTEREGLLKRLSSSAFYRLFTFLSGSKIEPGMADFRLLDRDVVRELRRFHEPHVFLRGLIQWIGFPSTTVRFRAPERAGGGSRYTWRKMVSLALTGVTAFSVVPLRFAIFLGFATALLAAAELAYVLVVALVFQTTVPGWASMTGIVSLLIGMLFVVLGVIGEYVGRIFEAVKARPAYVVQERVGEATREKSEGREVSGRA